MTEGEFLPAGGGAEVPEIPPRPRRWWVAGLTLLLVGALLATFIPGLLPREGTGSGTGFALAEGGYVLTAAHVVRGAAEISVYWEGRGYAASIIALSTDQDVALLVSDTLPPVPVVLLAGMQPEFGDPVTAVGHPGGAPRPTALSTSVAGIGWWAVGPEGAVLRGLIATRDSFRRGYSGAPLVNGRGQVVGVVTGSMTAASGEQFGFAVSIHRVVDWLSDRGIGLPTGSGDLLPPMEESEIVARLTPSVFRVEARFPPGAR